MAFTLSNVIYSLEYLEKIYVPGTTETWSFALNGNHSLGGNTEIKQAIKKKPIKHNH